MIELVFVTLAVAIMSAIAFSRYPVFVEQQRARSAERILMDIKASQERFREYFGHFAENIDDLDASWENITGFTAHAYNDTDQVAALIRSGGAYRLFVDANGNITCTGENCSILGYPSE